MDITLESIDDRDDTKFDIALYLVNNGYCDKQDKEKFLYKACYLEKLDVVKELVEQHNVDPKGEYHHSSPPHCTVGGVLQLPTHGS